MAVSSFCARSLDYCASDKPLSPALSPSPLARPRFFVACCAEELSIIRKRRVSIFWDLDNKPPKASPYHAALYLRRVATQFGDIEDMVACANRHAFTHIPRWVQEQRGSTHPNPNDMRIPTKPNCVSISATQDPTSPCKCAICGFTCAADSELKKHVSLLHKRMLRDMGFKIHDIGGYGLHMELLRAGFWVRMVDPSPQATDRALKRQMKHSMNNNIHCICLVSDDSDFTDILKMARSKEIFIVVVGDSASLHQYADIWFSWTEAAHGKDVRSTCTWQGIGDTNLAYDDSDDAELLS
ncbi:hypothetical protein GOP47_0010024 [Adiantum capillus-veneris]|uniref:C2H2-type domain-containing protein n=1 Tax=Adiantum capillus-veneris TaxID=13818 RepID=A0A9D4UYJ0_ADICA|nr:hypothetical protein GOP47_0010024 [Adiantum capillus-veneris]